MELLAAGLLKRHTNTDGHTWLRVSDAGLQQLALTLAQNRAVRSEHEALVDLVAREMARAGRIAWRGLSLRTQIPAPADSVSGEAAPASRWVMAQPDVFSIRQTSVEAYAEPLVHEIKVRRADLLSDLRQPGKRAAYLSLGGACWYVLGLDNQGRNIGTADDVPPECGVLLLQQSRSEHRLEHRLEVARPAPQRRLERLPFSLWMALAKATPAAAADDEAQGRF